VTEVTRRVAILREIDDWFGERGFGLILTEEDGAYWAHLSQNQLDCVYPEVRPWTITGRSCRERSRSLQG